MPVLRRRTSGANIRPFAVVRKGLRTERTENGACITIRLGAARESYASRCSDGTIERDAPRTTV